MLSPQIGLQVQTGVQIQIQPGKTPSPFAVHPLPSPGTPSSQTSLPTILPSFKIGVQVVGEAPLQVHPVSTVHVALHPSPAAVLLSSHASDPVFNPFPHMPVQVNIPGGVPVHV